MRRRRRGPLPEALKAAAIASEMAERYRLLAGPTTTVTPISALERLAEAILEGRVEMLGEQWESRDGDNRFSISITVAERGVG